MPGIGKAAASGHPRGLPEGGLRLAAKPIVCQAAAEIAREGDPRRAARQAATAGVTNEGDPSCAAATYFGTTAAGSP